MAKAKGNASNKAGVSALTLVYTATADKAIVTRAASAANDLFYVFNQSDNKGFVIVAADDAVSPILAYSHENSFDADNMPCNVKAVLDTYRNAITEAIANGEDASSEWTNIAAGTSEGEYLVKTKWGQGVPYNNMCPTIYNQHCVTGCAATAMAQLMRYWKYPAQGIGNHEYWFYINDEILSADFTEKLDWDNMRENYGTSEAYTDEEAHAVAHLMRQCGVATEMRYSLNSSCVDEYAVMTALATYFKYNAKSMRLYQLRDIVSHSKWLDLIHDEIDAKRPILYGSINHMFICDGYQGNDYLHVNYGWCGNYDGFYKFMDADALEYLNSESTQIMVCGVSPDADCEISDATYNVKTNEFYVVGNTDSISSGENICGNLEITPNTGSITTLIEEVGVASVDENNKLLEILDSRQYNNRLIVFSCVNIYNLGTEYKTLRLMPAWKKDGEWRIATDATPKTYHIAPMPDEPKATHFSMFMGNADTLLTKNGETQYLRLHMEKSYDEDCRGYFKGFVRLTLTDKTGYVVLQTEKNVTTKPEFNGYAYFELPALPDGLYTAKFEMVDDDGIYMTQWLSKEPLIYTRTIDIGENPHSPYLSSIELDKDNCRYVVDGNRMIIEEIKVKYKYENPTDQACTKDIAFIKSYTGLMINKNTQPLLQTTITIPANGEYEGTFKYPGKDFFADRDEAMVELCEIDPSQGVYYVRPTYITAYRVNLWTNNVQTYKFACTPTIGGVNIDECSIPARMGQNVVVNFDLTESDGYFGVYHKLIGRLYDGDKLLQEVARSPYVAKTTNFNHSTNRQWSLEGFDVEPGDYTLKFFYEETDVSNYIPYADVILNEEGTQAIYTVHIANQEMTPQESHCPINGENYMFSANNADLIKGKQTELKYCLLNPANVDFEGTIRLEGPMVKYTTARTTSQYIISEEKQLTIKANSEEPTYGTIGITVPSEWSGSELPLKLMAKSQYDDDYQEIPNGSIRLNIVNDPTGINDIAVDDQLKYHVATIILPNGNAIKNVSIYDVSGSRVSGYAVSDNTIDLRQLTNGIYIVEITTTTHDKLRYKVVR